MPTKTDTKLRIRRLRVPGGPDDAIVVEAPKTAVMTTTQVEKGITRGWLATEGHEVVVRPAGPASDPWLQSPSAPQPHVFHHYDTLIIGRNPPVRYKVVRQPDKYVRGGKDTDKVTDEAYAEGQTEVVWHYELELEKS